MTPAFAFQDTCDALGVLSDSPARRPQGRGGSAVAHGSVLSAWPELLERSKDKRTVWWGKTLRKDFHGRMPASEGGRALPGVFQGVSLPFQCKMQMGERRSPARCPACRPGRAELASPPRCTHSSSRVAAPTQPSNPGPPDLLSSRFSVSGHILKPIAST